MLLLGGVGVVVELTLLVYCVLNVATTPSEQVRNLPKPTWLLLVILLPLIGGIAWLVAGRPRVPGAGQRVPGTPPPQRRPPAAPTRPSSPDDDEDFLRSLRRRAQEQREQAERDRHRDTPEG